MIDCSRTVLLAALVAAFALFATACGRQADTPSPTSPRSASAFQNDDGRFITSLQEQSEVGSEFDNGTRGNDSISIADSESRNTSEINVEVSDLSQPLQRFYFAINRDQHYVRVVDADAMNTPTETGDVFVTLAVEILDPGAFSTSGEVEAQSLAKLAIEYNEDAIRISEVASEDTITNGDGQAVILDLSTSTDGPRIASIQSQAKGALIALEVEAMDTSGAAGSGDDPLLDIGEFATGFDQDKRQKFIDLAGKTEAGRVDVNVRIRGSDPDCPQPCKVASLESPEEEDEPPEESPPPSDTDDNETDSDQEPEDSGPEPQDGPLDSQDSQSDGQGTEGEGTGSGETLPENPPEDEDETSEDDAPDPNQPDGDDTILENNGNMNPSIDNVAVMLIIDNSGSMLYYDPKQHKERVDAALAYLSTSLTGDLVGVVQFAIDEDTTSPIPITHGGVHLSTGKKKLINAIENVKDTSAWGSNINRALRSACNELESLDEGDFPKRAAILLTNDQATSDPSGDLQCFIDHGWPIYVFGLGHSESLEGIATATGGTFIQFDEPTDDPTLPVDLLSLVCEVQRVRTTIAGGESPSCAYEYVERGKKITQTLQIPPAQVQATFTVSWETGSNLFIEKVIPPSPEPEETIYSFEHPPHVVRARSDTYEVFSILNPEPGTWKIVIKDPTMPPGRTDFVFGYSTIPIAP